MDTTPLVMDEIEAGKEFIRRLHAYQPVKAAWWMRETEDAGRYLHVALEGLTMDSIKAAYREVLRIANEMKDHYIDPFWVRLVSPDDPAASAVLDIYRRYPGRVPPQFNGSALGRVPVVEVYVYPPQGIVTEDEPLNGSAKWMMAQFIQVRGPDPDYKGLYRTMLLAVSAIVRIVPVFVEVANGTNFLCTEDHPNAAILYYKLIDVHGNEYAIGAGLLEKIGAAFDLPIPNVTTFKHGDWPNKRKQEGTTSLSTAIGEGKVS